MKLFTRYNQIHLAALAIVFVISGIIYYFLINKVLIDELDDALGEYKIRVEKYVHEYDSLPVFMNFEEIEVAYQPIKNKLSAGYATIERYDPEEKKMGAYRQLIFYQSVKNVPYEIKIAKPVEGTNLLINVIACSTIAMILLIMLIAVVLNRVILKRLWHPFFVTMEAMKGFKLGGAAVPQFPSTKIEEFSLMNFRLLELINAAKDEYQILKEFTENAAHEMQTPLAIIRSKLDLAIQDEGLSEEHSLALKSAYSGVHRLTKLGQSLLLLAKIENKQYAAMKHIDMKEKIEEKIDQFNELWAGQDISVNIELEAATLTANSELIDILLNNLFSNASRHNVEKGRIQIVLRKHYMSISNTAKLNALDTAKLFNRFYKQDPFSQNNGLGLAIVQQIAQCSGIIIHYDFKDQQHVFSVQFKNDQLTRNLQ